MRSSDVPLPSAFFVLQRLRPCGFDCRSRHVTGRTVPGIARAQRPAATITHTGGMLLRAGRPHRILSGLPRYFRVHPEQWAVALLLRSRRPEEPFLCAEFRNAWFDHWGEPHHVRPAAGAADDMGRIPEGHGPVSFCMAHGGTNVGLRAGANHDGNRLQPTVTSYDSDAPIAEHGALTDKFSEQLALCDRPDPGEPQVCIETFDRPAEPDNPRIPTHRHTPTPKEHTVATPRRSPGHTARRTRAVGALAAAALALVGTVLNVNVPAASAADPTYTVTVGAKGGWTHPDDTPAYPYIDKDGTFYYQQAHSLYGPSDSRTWTFYTGADLDTATRSAAISDSGTNADTTTLCNNSPTGTAATFPPSGSGYSQRNFCDLAGVWVDPDSGDWYGLVHNEFTPQPFGDSSHFDAIDYAVSTDQGRHWTIKGHALTSPYSTARGDTTAFPQQTYSYGDGDQRLYVDAASGYFYVFYGSRLIDKNGGWKAFYSHVARAPLSGKMASGTWQKWYGGSWSQPGVGGRESNTVPVTATDTTGYTPTAKEYDPANTGSVDQQVAAGKTPPTSPLFVMDITYNAYLGLYIGEPQAADQSGNAPQQLYATDNLATQKWRLIGDTGEYHTASWYRWFLDGISKTGSAIVGKDFRSYCSFGCSGGASGEYVNLTVNSSAPAPATFDPARTYRIAGGGGRILAQVSSASSATTSTATSTGTGLDAWTFTGTGDGSYRIANAATGQLLGVPTTAATGRAWGSAPTVTPPGSGGPTVGQQWFVVPNTSSVNGAATGTYRLVNRYSGLVVGLSGVNGRLAETTPVRAWTDTAGSTVGGGRGAAEQTLTVTAVGTSAAGLNGDHTLTTGGQALDNPGHSTTAGTQLITYTANGGANQTWTLSRQNDGSYELRNAESGLCADVSDGSIAAGAKIIQWTCTSGTNQHWTFTRLPDGTYSVTSVKSNLVLTAASTSQGALLTQQTDTGSDLQRWTVG